MTEEGRLILVAVSVLVAGSAGCSSVIQHPNFARRHTEIYRIAVVTPCVEFHCKAPRSREALPEKESELREELLAAITHELGVKGFSVQFPQWKALLAASNASDQALAFSDAIDRATARSNFHTFIRFQSPEKWATPQQREDVRLLAKLANADT